MSIRVMSSRSFRELFQILDVYMVILRLAGLPKPGIGIRLPGTNSKA